MNSSAKQYLEIVHELLCHSNQTPNRRIEGRRPQELLYFGRKCSYCRLSFPELVVVLSASIWAHLGWSQLGCHEPNGVNGYLYSPGVFDISIISLTPL